MFACFHARADTRAFVLIEGQIGDRPYEDAGEQWRSPRGLRALHCRLR
jgi:hypothetical protein